MIVILQEEDHPLFRRVDIDLLMKKKISLKEALCGCEFTIKHLDGQQLLVKTKPGEVVAPGECGGGRGGEGDRGRGERGGMCVFPSSSKLC